MPASSTIHLGELEPVDLMSLTRRTLLEPSPDADGIGSDRSARPKTQPSATQRVHRRLVLIGADDRTSTLTGFLPFTDARVVTCITPQTIIVTIATLEAIITVSPDEEVVTADSVDDVITVEAVDKVADW